MKRAAVFIDRDGTINEQMGYINHLERFIILPGAAEAIRLLNLHGILAIVVSNQSGAARGYFPLSLIETVHEFMKASLAEKGARLDGIFYCPHHPRALLSELRVECECRKPGTGLVERACKDFDIDMSRSYVVGDRCSDIELAHRCKLKSALVKTGYGRGEIEYLLPSRAEKPSYVAEDLHDAIRWILEREKPGLTQ